MPYVAAIPGYGLPMANNVFLNANYGWVFIQPITNTDNQTYFNNTDGTPAGKNGTKRGALSKNRQY